MAGPAEHHEVTTHPTGLDPANDDGDLLDRLGFVPADSADEPLLSWPRLTVRPTVRRGRHRAVRPRAA